MGLGYYVERRLNELNQMRVEDVAARPIRAHTHPRVKEKILAARAALAHHEGKKTLTPKLKDGDVLLLRKNNRGMSSLISKVTKSDYVHAGVYNKGKFYDSLSPLAKKPGGNISTLDELAERDKGLTYDVFRPKDQSAAKEAARNIERMTNETTGYSISNAVQAGMRDRLGFGFGLNYKKNYRICSELVYDCFNGRIGSDSGASVSPGRLAVNPNLQKVHTLKLSLNDLIEACDAFRQ